MLKLLLKHDIVTGPLEKNTSYSRLDSLRKFLLGMEQFKGGEHFLTFGSAVHELFLEGKKDTFKTLPKQDQRIVLEMVKSLQAHPVVQSLMEGGISEEKLYGHLHGVEFAYIIDRKQIHLDRGFDLKTTMCKTQQEFEEKSYSYGYPKQGYVYKTLGNLSEFYFVGIQKVWPYKVFIVSTDSPRWREEERYAAKEIEFLCYFYQNYGNFVTDKIRAERELAKNEVNDKLITMAKTSTKGKEALYAILAQFKKVVDHKKQEHKHKVAVTRESAKVKKMVNKFPKDERPLYEEKLVKIIEKL